METIPDALRRFKATDPDRIVIFTDYTGTLLVSGDDATALRPITEATGRIGCAVVADGLAYQSSDLEPIITAILSAGLRAAVVERVRDGKAPKGEKVERVVVDDV